MRSTLLVSMFAVAAIAACGKPKPAPSADQDDQAAAGEPSAAEQAAAAKTEAHDIFKNRCTPCHGAEGRGNGAASVSLNPKPRNFHDHAWHHTVDDAYIEKIIKLGGAAVGKSPAMPSNPDLNAKSAVVAEIRTIVRGFNSAD